MSAAEPINFWRSVNLTEENWNIKHKSLLSNIKIGK